MRETANGGQWLPKESAPAGNPHMSDRFAQVYELTAHRITGPVAVQALRLAGPIDAHTRILDIAAGAGALSIPAAFSGATVMAVDIAPGMVNLLSERLKPFPNAQASVMDGQALAIDDDSFDLAFSIFGVSLFNDWRTGLAEQVRVLRSGGKACIATWKTPPGGGPFLVMAQAIRAVFPQSMPPAPPGGFIALADPARIVTELEEAGLVDVHVVEVQAVWQGATGQAYLDELHDLHRFMPPYAALDEQGRREVDRAILRTLDAYTVGERTHMVSPVLIATATKP